MIIYTYTLQGNAMPGGGSPTPASTPATSRSPPLSLQMAVVTLTLIPILMAYPFVQRHFAKGMLTGAIKG